MTASATWVQLQESDIIAVTNSCILIGHKAKTYWVPKHSVMNPDQFQYGLHNVTVWVTLEYAKEEGLCQ